jgi:organic hydroperoxide reductase OsmC/OhrA
MATTGRVYEFDVAVDRNGTATSGLGGASITKEEAWWAEHLVLAGLVRCTLASLSYSARRAEVEVAAQGRAHGTVAKRESDGLYAFVEVESSFDVELSPPLDADALAELLDRAERGCFVGNSLRARPRYRWRVNGEEVR